MEEKWLTHNYTSEEESQFSLTDSKTLKVFIIFSQLTGTEMYLFLFCNFYKITFTNPVTSVIIIMEVDIYENKYM